MSWISAGIDWIGERLGGTDWEAEARKIAEQAARNAGNAAANTVTTAVVNSRAAQNAARQYASTPQGMVAIATSPIGLAAIALIVYLIATRHSK